jgi:hypothetical protein
MKMKTKISRKKGPVRAKKVSFDGINFASGLEKYMYVALKEAKIKSVYEGQTYVLQEAFQFETDSFERQGNGKGEMINRGHKKISKYKIYTRFCK